MVEIENKIKITLFSLSLIAAIVILFANDFGHTSSLEQMSIAETEYNELKESRQEVDADRDFSIKFNEYTLPYDQETNSYLFSLDSLEHLNNFNPNVSIVTDENLTYDVAFKEEMIDAEALENQETMELLVYNDEHFVEYEIGLTTLPIVQLDIDQALEDEGKPIGDTDHKGQMTLYDNNPKLEDSEKVITSDLNIRIRGGSSRAFPKNQYRVNLREFSIGGDEDTKHLSLLGMREDDDWILYSPYNDPEKIRNTFATNMWYETMASENRFGLKNGTEGEYVEVFIGDRYWGLYTLMHPLDDEQLEVDYAQDPEESEIFYRTVSNVPFDPEKFKQATGQEMLNGRFELRDIDEPFYDKNQWKPIYEHMMMQQADSETLRSYLAKQTDIENQINYYLFTLFLQATDNNFKNRNYISKFDGDTRVMLESPWDLDLILGLQWDEHHPRKADMTGNSNQNYVSTASLIHTAMNQDMTGITQQVKEEYQNLREEEWSEKTLNAVIDEYEKDIYASGAIHRDKKRWQDTAYNEGIDTFRNYVMERLQHMDKFIETEL